jgi:hypothetical protein
MACKSPKPGASRRHSAFVPALLAPAVLALALQGCNRAGPQTPDSVSAPAAAMRLVDGPVRPIAYAPPGPALPYAEPAPMAELLAPDASYAYVDDAAYMGDAFFDGPPDYAFAYDGVEPWAWRADDDALALVEALSGGYRYYYYEPGDDWPFLVRDEDYAYGFDRGRLVTVYDRSGRVMPASFLAERAPLAGRYLARGRGLYQASRGPDRRAVNQQTWLARRQQVSAINRQWTAERTRTPDWRNFHSQYAPQQDARWAPERYRREAAATRLFQRVNDPRAADRHWQAALQARREESQPRTLPARPGLRAFSQRGAAPTAQQAALPAEQRTAARAGATAPQTRTFERAQRAEVGQTGVRQTGVRQTGVRQTEVRQAARAPMASRAGTAGRAQANLQVQRQAQAPARIQAESRVQARQAQFSAQAEARRAQSRAPQIQARAQVQAHQAQARAQVQARPQVQAPRAAVPAARQAPAPRAAGQPNKREH